MLRIRKQRLDQIDQLLHSIFEAELTFRPQVFDIHQRALEDIGQVLEFQPVGRVDGGEGDDGIFCGGSGDSWSGGIAFGQKEIFKGSDAVAKGRQSLRFWLGDIGHVLDVDDDLVDDGGEEGA